MDLLELGSKVSNGSDYRYGFQGSEKDDELFKGWDKWNPNTVDVEEDVGDDNDGALVVIREGMLVARAGHLVEKDGSEPVV